MSRVRVYLTPFDTVGNFASEIEITDDVIKIGKLQKQLDQTEYDLGIFRSSNLTITLRNDHGHYSSVNELTSVFAYKRSGSKLRITWDLADEDLVAGFFEAGYETLLPDEQAIFAGVLDDTEIKTNIDGQTLDFKILGYESLIDKAEIPYASINNGDSLDDVIYTALNQSTITNYLTVSSSNINCDYNPAIDDKSSLENKTLKSAFKDILFASNSVLYIDGTSVVVSSRDPTVSVIYTFYGHSSETPSVQTVIDIKNHREGLNRVFNHWTFRDTALVSRDASSIAIYGTRTKEIGLDIITDNTKRGTLLSTNVTEFRNPKIEFDLIAPMNYETLALKLLDRVRVDFPNTFEAPEFGVLSRYNESLYGEATFAIGEYSLAIDPQTDFKIMAIDQDVNSNTITFSLREV